jgi:hypothetical protein
LLLEEPVAALKPEVIEL